MDEHSSSSSLPLLQPLLFTEYASAGDRERTHVQFVAGNPQLEVRAGVVVLAEPVQGGFESVEQLLAHPTEELPWERFDCSKRKDVDVSAMSETERRFLCMLIVPPHMIPRELVLFLFPFLHAIRTVRILRHYTETNKYLAVIEAYSAEGAIQLVNELQCKEFNSLEPTRCLIFPCSEVRLFGKETTESSDEQRSPTQATPTGTEEDAVCPVCLEPIDANCAGRGAFITNCNHIFHLDCARQLEGAQCPVCRFQHDTGFECLSECQVCHARAPNDVWVCVVCGFVACGASLSHHIREHYATTLHTYAMNTETHQVWDFAGDGFVHRLIVEKGDPSDDTEPVRTKLVEVTDPHSRSHERPHRPPMSDQIEELVIHSKLERVARRYNNLLSWQLEQQRDQYQQELDAIRTSYGHPPQEQLGSKQAATGTWGEQLIASLKNERAKLRQKCDSTTERIASANKELQFLQDLNESLLANRSEWESQTKTADADLREAEEAYRRWIPALEKKVRDLMIKLEQSESKGADDEECKR